MLFDAHQHAFTLVDAILERGIYDNMKTAVDTVGRGKHRKVNKRCYAMVSITCIGLSSAILQRAGSRGRSRRWCRMHGTACGTTRHPSNP